MGKASLALPVNADAAAAWDYIGDFNGLPRWHPAVAASRLEQGGEIRLTLHDGAELVERLLGRDEAQRSCSYSITETPLPIKRHAATIRVNAAAGRSTDWRCEFESAGPPDAEIAAIFQQIFQDPARAGIASTSRLTGGESEWIGRTR